MKRRPRTAARNRHPGNRRLSRGQVHLRDAGSPRLVAFLVGLTAAVVLALGPLAPSAGAHDGEAVLTVEATHPAGLSVHYIVRVTWADDGHPAADATVTATGVAPDGSQLTPVSLAPADDDGRYSGVVDYPEAGSWTVRITAIDPTGTVEQAQEVTAPATTAPEADDSEGTTAGEDGDGSATEGFAPQDDGTGSSDETAAGSSGGDDGGMPVYLLVAAAVVVLVGAATSINVIRRNRTVPARAEATGSAPDGERTADAAGPGEVAEDTGSGDAGTAVPPGDAPTSDR